MKITGVRVKKIEGDSRLKAIVSITIDDALAIHELRVIDGKNGLFVAMPSRKTADESFRDIAHPINAETRKEIEDEILKAYHEAE